MITKFDFLKRGLTAKQANLWMDFVRECKRYRSLDTFEQLEAAIKGGEISDAEILRIPQMGRKTINALYAAIDVFIKEPPLTKAAYKRKITIRKLEKIKLKKQTALNARSREDVAQLRDQEIADAIERYNRRIAKIDILEKECTDIQQMIENA